MVRPQPPRLSPITREKGGMVRLIPIGELLEQVQEMDRLGTWHLAQALALQTAFDNGTAEENRYGVNKLHRHLQFAGAMLGSINARIATYKFVKEVRNGEHGARFGDPEGYYRGAGAAPGAEFGEGADGGDGGQV